MFYDDDKTPAKTVYFDASCYADYTVALHDEDKRARYIKGHKDREKWNDKQRRTSQWTRHEYQNSCFFA